MNALMVIVLCFLLSCAVATCLAKDLLVSVIIFMAYSLLMSILWILLQSPDLAITEAAVGAGITTVLLLLTLKRVGGVKK